MLDKKKIQANFIKELMDRRRWDWHCWYDLWASWEVTLWGYWGLGFLCPILPNNLDLGASHVQYKFFKGMLPSLLRWKFDFQRSWLLLCKQDCPEMELLDWWMLCLPQIWHPKRGCFLRLTRYVCSLVSLHMSFINTTSFTSGCGQTESSKNLLKEV